MESPRVTVRFDPETIASLELILDELRKKDPDLNLSALIRFATEKFICEYRQREVLIRRIEGR